MIYIGQTIQTLEDRWRQHRKKGSTCLYLKRAFEKYSIDNFIFEMICSCNNEELDKLTKGMGKGYSLQRFKGLGEISPEEFGRFIGDDIRLQPVLLEQGEHIQNLLEYYMGKNTQERQIFIIDNLRIELDKAETTI